MPATLSQARLDSTDLCLSEARADPIAVWRRYEQPRLYHMQRRPARHGTPGLSRRLDGLAHGRSDVDCPSQRGTCRARLARSNSAATHDTLAPFRARAALIPSVCPPPHDVCVQRRMKSDMEEEEAMKKMMMERAMGK